MSCGLFKNSWDSNIGSNGVSQYKDPKYKRPVIIPFKAPRLSYLETWRSIKKGIVFSNHHWEQESPTFVKVVGLFLGL
jgi:hypothetical protein